MFAKILSSAVIFILSILGILPLKLRRGLGQEIGRLAYFISKRENQIANLQLQKILNLPPEKAQNLSLKVYQSICISILEALNLKPILNNPNQVEVNNPELLKEYANSNSSTILLSAHVGNWELLAAYLIKTQHPLVAIGRPMKRQLSQDLLVWLREKYQVTTAWRGSISGTKELSRNLKKGATLGGLIDQDIKLKGLIDDFLGVPCKTSTPLVDLGLKAKSRFISVFIFRIKNNNYKIYIDEIKSENREGIIKEYNQSLSDLIRKYPEQWVWFHKRWRTQELDQTMSSQEYLDFLKK